MLIWGAAWGAVLGWIVSRFEGAGLIVGALMGLAAGATLRWALDTRIKELLAAQRSQQRSHVRPANQAVSAPVGSEQHAWALLCADEPPQTAIGEVANVQVRHGDATTDAASQVPERFNFEMPPPETNVPQAHAPEARAREATLRRPAPQPPIESTFDTAFERARAWLFGGNTVARLGAVVLFIGLAFLARFAVDRGLVPPQLRLAGIGVVAIVLLVLGFRLRERATGYALTLQGAGVAVLYLTLFAAMRLYGLMPASLVFALMVAVCALSAVLAVVQDARALAVLGAAGGFVAPILASTGQGDHVALFTYYAVLNLGILGIALKKNWQLLNRVGFVCTFGIATAWGVLRYQPELYDTTQPFLLLFFALFVAVAVLYALRRAGHADPVSARARVDTALVFGTPLVSMGLQAALVRGFEHGLAWSALGASVVYLSLAAVLARWVLQTQRLLIECFLALGVIFFSLAIPFALDARWTAAFWAMEGAAVVWVGVRQQRRLARAFGLLLQVGGLFAFLTHLQNQMPQLWPVLNADFVGAVVLAAAALWTSRKLYVQDLGLTAQQRSGYEYFECFCATVLFLYGFAWWIGALVLELTRQVPSEGGWVSVIAASDRLFPLMAGFVLSASLAAAVGARKSWPVATWPALASVPVMLLVAFIGAVEFKHVFTHWGALCWPVALVAHAWGLRRVDSMAGDESQTPKTRWVAVHALGAMLLCALAVNGTKFVIDAAQLWRTSWGPSAALVAAATVLSLIRVGAFSSRWAPHWPMHRYARAYGWYGLLPVVVLTAWGALWLTLTQSGKATPLPHVPLINPVDLAYLLALWALWRWREEVVAQRAVAPPWPLPEFLCDTRVAVAALGAALFLALNTVWLRAVHHYAGVPWRAQALFDSFLAQTGYALLWTVTALGLMVFASRRSVRAPWLAGAVLLGATVVKLLLIDLKNSGGFERIVAFIGVGGLMLLVGYLAPLPPKKLEEKAT